jgi:hypothetical protein
MSFYRPSLLCPKIIQRSRQNHLFDKFRSEANKLSSELIAQVRDAWRKHMRENVGKGLSETEKPVEGEEENTWPRIADLIENKDWRQECLKRDQKFDMHFSSAVRPHALCSSFEFDIG